MRLIDADALVKRLKKHKNLFCENQVEFRLLSIADKAKVNEIDNCIAEVINAPTIEPERKTGMWELIDDTEFRIPGYRCSVCHCECEDWKNKPTYNYCPNCGAKMEGTE